MTEPQTNPLPVKRFLIWTLETAVTLHFMGFLNFSSNSEVQQQQLMAFRIVNINTAFTIIL